MKNDDSWVLSDEGFDARKSKNLKSDESPLAIVECIDEEDPQTPSLKKFRKITEVSIE